MYSFGKRPVRAMHTFGVSGLLGDECRIFYSSLFSTKHIGRVSDLLAARLRKFLTDECRFRAMILYSAFEAFQAQLEQHGSVEPLMAPLSLECGIDSEKIAISTSFVAPQSLRNSLTGLPERLAAGQSDTPLERLIAFLWAHSNRLVIRFQPETGKIEILSVLGIEGRMDQSLLNEAQQVEIIILEKDVPEPPPATAYVELGDLDYATLLHDDSPAKQIAPSPTGEILYKAIRPNHQDEQTTQVVPDNAPKVTEDKIIISESTEPSAQDSTKISGVTENRQDEQVLIDDATLNIQDDVNKIKATTEHQDDAITVIKGDGQVSDESQSVFVIKGDSADAETQGRQSSFLKKLWPFNKMTESESESEAEAESESELDEATETPDTDNINEKSVPEQRLITEEKPSTSVETDKIEESSDAAINSFEHTITRAKQEANDIKNDFTTPRAKRWVDGLIGELVAEKVKIKDLSKKLSTAARQKEIEFINKERIMLDEIKHREETIRQKNFALARAKEQLSQVTLNMEKLKSSDRRSTEDLHLKQKHATLQRILTATRAENNQLAEKVEELRSMLNSTQYNAKTRGPSFSDYGALQAKAERSQRLVEEFKKTNQQMMIRLTELKKEREANAGSVEEMKKRLEEATRIVNNSRDTQQKLTLRVEESMRTEMGLRRELEHTLMENKKLRSAGGGKQGQGAPPTAAA